MRTDDGTVGAALPVLLGLRRGGRADSVGHPLRGGWMRPGAYRLGLTEDQVTELLTLLAADPEHATMSGQLCRHDTARLAMYLDLDLIHVQPSPIGDVSDLGDQIARTLSRRRHPSHQHRP